MGTATEYLKHATKRGKEIEKDTLDTLLNDDQHKREHNSDMVKCIFKPINVLLYVVLILGMLLGIWIIQWKVSWLKIGAEHWDTTINLEAEWINNQPPNL